MTRLRTIILTCLCVGFLMSVAQAQTPLCTDRSTIIEKMQRLYSETPVAMGIASNNGVIEVLASPGGRTWTIIITPKGGATCLVAAGEHWRTARSVIDPFKSRKGFE